jgi:hypothetical protein
MGPHRQRVHAGVVEQAGGIPPTLDDTVGPEVALRHGRGLRPIDYGQNPGAFRNGPKRARELREMRLESNEMPLQATRPNQEKQNGDSSKPPPSPARLPGCQGEHEDKR